MTRTLLFAAVLAGTVSAAAAQVYTVPNPANPNPDHPIATDGSPLPRMNGADARFAPAGRNGLSTYTGEYSVEIPRAR